MKSNLKILILALCLGAMTTLFSCGDDDDNCPDKTFNSLADCEDATDGMRCICVKEGSEWKAIIDP